MKKPLLSIIIPVLNNLDGLKKSVESIHKQLFTNYEVWIIDGNSIDKTLTYLETLEFPFQFISENDTGIYYAMNKGIKLAKGEWFYFLGSGDILYNERILNDIFGSNKYLNNILLSGKVLYEGDKSPFIYSKNKREMEPSWSILMWIRNGLHHQGTFYNKKIFKARNYNLKYKIFSDYWLNLLLYKKGYSCKFLPFRVAICDSNGVSKQRSWRNYKEEINLKTALSSVVLKPFFYLLCLLKSLSSKFK